jgi:methyl-accepting chemotaxis protein
MIPQSDFGQVKSLMAKCFIYHHPGRRWMKYLIEESVKNANGGVVINEEVFKNLNEIHSEVIKVSEVVAEIAAAAEQQNQGVDRINLAIDQMNQVTQQTAANAEESASASEELSGQANEMNDIVGSFHLTGSLQTNRQMDKRQPSSTPRWRKIF